MGLDCIGRALDPPLCVGATKESLSMLGMSEYLSDDLRM